MNSRSTCTRKPLAVAHGDRVAWAVVVAATAVLFSLPAILNGYPLVFDDTNVYIGTWHGGLMPPYYSAAVWVTSRAVSTSFTVFVQACLTAYVVCRFVQVFGGVRSPLAIFAYAAAIAGASQLPWLASYLMPDVLAGVGFACLMLVFLGPTALSGAERWFLLALAVICTVVATANVLVLVPLCLGYLAYLCASAHRRSTHRQLVFQTVAYVAVVLLLSTLPNKAKVDRWTINIASGALAFSLLVDEGIAQDYLRENCPAVLPKVCALLPELEQIEGDQAFLWEGLADRHQAWTDPDGEFARLSRKIMLARPGDVLAVMARQTIELLGRVSLANPETRELISYVEDGAWFQSILLRELPDEYAQFAGALQQKGEITEYYPDVYYTIMTYLGYVILAIFSFNRVCRTDRISASLILTSLSYITFGLMVHGGLVGPYPRYHVKLAWTAWLVLAVVFHRACIRGPVRRISADNM